MAAFTAQSEGPRVRVSSLLLSLKTLLWRTYPAITNAVLSSTSLIDKNRISRDTATLISFIRPLLLHSVEFIYLKGKPRCLREGIRRIRKFNRERRGDKSRGMRTERSSKERRALKANNRDICCNTSSRYL